jgi:glutamate racemase
MGEGITLIDSAEQTAAAVARELAESGIENARDAEGRAHFIVSDAPEQFERVGAAFLGDRVRDIETVMLGH